MIRYMLYIALGGALGSMLRFLFNYSFQYVKIFRVEGGTLAANLMGSFLIGVFFGYSIKQPVPDAARLFLVTGILGGFTTFSAFSLENMQLLKDGEVRNMILNMLTQNILGIILALAGYYSGKSIGS
jgi:CrcB protein